MRGRKHSEDVATEPYAARVDDANETKPSSRKKTFSANLCSQNWWRYSHALLDQAMAFLFFNKILDDVFIAMVDDWNWSQVREGTFEAFKRLDYQVLYEVRLPARYNADRELWWNGFYVAVVRKKPLKIFDRPIN